ncbi:MAG: Uma2 family endonuclease [Polyangiaceae bacterium]|nr:Uma2 family endonuclease [Polyangiaceae bacterium]
MLLGGEVRAADAAVWRESPAGDGFARTAPLLAVEVCGADDTIDRLRQKARWYIAHGVTTVWIVTPATRRVTSDGESETTPDRAMPEPAGLPGLSPAVSSFFRQLS